MPATLLRKLLGPVSQRLMAPLQIWLISLVTVYSAYTQSQLRCMSRRKRTVAQEYNLDPRVLTKKGGDDNYKINAARITANMKAKNILRVCKTEDRMVSDAELTEVLEIWGFNRNRSRGNVQQSGVTYVWSDTFGLLRNRRDMTNNTKPTIAYPDFVELMTKWLTDRLPQADQPDFRWTSFAVNKNLGAKLHRDKNNCPRNKSMVSAFGPFSGGSLRYYAHDDGKIDLQKLLTEVSEGSEEPIVLDLKNGVALFGGKLAHAVDDFTGTRYSIVFYTVKSHSDMPASARSFLHGIGIPTPDSDTSPPTDALPEYRYWMKRNLGP